MREDYRTRFKVVVSCRKGEGAPVTVNEGVNWFRAGWEVIKYRLSGLNARAVRLGVEPEIRQR